MAPSGQSSAAILVLSLVHAAAAAAQEAAPAATPQQQWARLRRELPPFAYRVVRDELVPSDTEPSLRLRRVEVQFRSQSAGRLQHPMDHTGVVFMPADPAVYQAPGRRGKVVIVGQRLYDSTVVDNYGEPIAARTGYPTMVLPVPGEFDGSDGESCWNYFTQSELARTKDPVDHNFFRLALPYVRALDVLAGLLGVEEIRAVIGGHSKRATSAYTAAAIDPERVVGLVLMGQEGNWRVPPVRAKVLYVGATNEAGYQMFNINRIQASMAQPWTLEYIPNYRHAANAERQALAWHMWVAHVFEGRPLTRIGELSHEEDAEGTFFRARVDTPNKIVHVKAWFVYNDGDPYWRDLMWYPVELTRRGERYEGYLEGQPPDAWFVEVKDIAAGVKGYVASLPQDLTRKQVLWRTGSMFPRHWRSKLAPQAAVSPAEAAAPPPELWARLQRTLPPLDYQTLRDEIVPSAKDPKLRLRRLEVRFRSQTVGRFRRQMDHTGVVFMPADSALQQDPGRRGKVVVVGQRLGNPAAPGEYGETIAARTGYPTMVLPVPGEYEGHEGENCWIYFLRSFLNETRDPADHHQVRLAVPYLRGMDVLGRILGIGAENVRAVIGGGGLRAAPAYAAAALDPQRVAGVVYVRDGTRTAEDELPPMTPLAALPEQWPVRAKLLYLDAARGSPPTISGGAAVPPGTVVERLMEGTGSDGQALAWRNWVAHVFDGRALPGMLSRPSR